MIYIIIVDKTLLLLLLTLLLSATLNQSSQFSTELFFKKNDIGKMFEQGKEENRRLKNNAN